MQRGIRYESLARSREFKEYVLQASNLRREGLLEDIASLAAGIVVLDLSRPVAFILHVHNMYI
eukprot:758917-Hanusia_phi.AAC.2